MPTTRGRRKNWNKHNKFGLHFKTAGLFTISAQNWSFDDFLAFPEKKLPGNKYFRFSCKILVMRQVFSHFLPEIDHATNSVASPSKNLLCNKYFCFSSQNFVVWQLFVLLLQKIGHLANIFAVPGKNLSFNHGTSLLHV